MAETILYVLPLILGRTFDMDKLLVGVDIFSSEQISKPTVIENPFSETLYSMVDTTKEARDLLDVSGSFSLKVKAGLFKAGASGAYLSDTYNRENTVEILVKATYETVTEILPYDASPFPAWKSLGALGTHYVRSITYGGQLLASVRLVCNNTMDKKHIKASLQLGGRIKIFDVGVEAEGEYLNDISNTVDTMQIKMFSSVPLSKIPHSMDALKKSLDQFPEDIKQYNGGKGVPVKVELWPLNYLDSTRPQYVKNSVLQAELENFEQKLDDLLNTKSALFNWMKSSNKVLTDDEEKKVGLLYGDVQKTLRPFYSVIGKLDTSQGLDQLKPAHEAYGRNKLPGAFYNRYLELRKAIMDDQGAWTSERGNGITFIHWGQHNCTSGAETLSSGYASGPKESGGGANQLCLTVESKKGPVSSEINISTLRNVTYQLPNEKGQVACCTCHLQTRGSIQVFSGLPQCPKGWDMQYRGILLSGSKDSIHTSHICLDKESSLQELNSVSSPLLPTWSVVTGSDTHSHKILPCIVCAK